MLELSLSDKIRRTEFLGREFLTWMMFRSARDEGVFRMTEGDVIEVLFERALTLEGENPAREMSSIKVDDPVVSQEVLLSLRLNKKVSRARITVMADGCEYHLLLDAATMSLRGVKLPDLVATDPIEALTEQSATLTAIEDTIHRLFIQFMRLRLDAAAWAEETGAASRWLAAT